MPAAAILAALAATRYGLRHDIAALGVLIAWGLSGAEWTFGLITLGIAFQHAVPGTPTSRQIRTVLYTTAGVVIVATTVVTYTRHPTFARSDLIGYLWAACFRGSLEYGARLMAVAVLLCARAFPTRAAVVGGLCGLAGGLVADAGWRLTCGVSSPGHVFGAHALAVASLVAIGATLSSLIERARRR